MPSATTAATPFVRDYLSRSSPAREPLPLAPPTVSSVTNWLCRRPDTLTEDEKPRLKAILDRCPELQAASDQVRAFAAMITGLTGENLPQWIVDAPTAGQPGIASFAKSLEQDLGAVTNGLTMGWTSGPVEAASNTSRCSSARSSAGPACPCSASASCSAMTGTGTFTKLGPDPFRRHRQIAGHGMPAVPT